MKHSAVTDAQLCAYEAAVDRDPFLLSITSRSSSLQSFRSGQVDEVELRRQRFRLKFLGRWRFCRVQLLAVVHGNHLLLDDACLADVEREDGVRP